VDVGTVNATGTITVTPNNTATLFINTNIVYQHSINSITTTTGAAGIGTATGLPAGVTAAFGSNITISGTTAENIQL
jgi:hypothetical protein